MVGLIEKVLEIQDCLNNITLGKINCSGVSWSSGHPVFNVKKTSCTKVKHISIIQNI